MKPFLLLMLISVSVLAHAQRPHVTPYLVIKLQPAYDKVHNKSYYKIDAEAGNPNAMDLYQLVPYVNPQATANSGIYFYTASKDQTPPYYNYFPTRTTALNFLSQKGWRLMQVVTEIKSDSASQWPDGKTVFPEITSTPVYYFKLQTFDNE